MSNSLQTCADLANNKQLESYRRLDSKPERPPRAPTPTNKPKNRGAFAAAPHPDAPDYYQECHWESMIYSGAYRVGIYTRDRVISSYKPKVMSRAIRKEKRFLRKKGEPRTEANLKVEPATTCCHILIKIYWMHANFLSSTYDSYLYSMSIF